MLYKWIWRPRFQSATKKVKKLADPLIFTCKGGFQMKVSDLVERLENRYWCAELHRLKGMFLAAVGGDEAQIEASFREAIRVAKEQKSVSLEKRAEATYGEYRRQKASGSGGRGFRLPLW